MARLYAEENFPLATVQALRQLGHDVVTALEAAQANLGIEDESKLEFARLQQRILLTLNRRDFKKLHRFHPNHAGMILCTENPNASQQASRIREALLSASDLDGILLMVNRPSR